MSEAAGNLAAQVTEIYHEIDLEIERVKQATGLHCVAGCGRCCQSPNVQSTVLEVLPLVLDIYWNEQEVEMMAILDEKENQENSICVMYRPDPLDSSKGRCGAYVHRPLLCRLFGFSSRRNKYDQIELSTCSTIREKFPEACARADIGIAAGMSFPVFQEAFMRVASLDASLGNRVFPINRAIREALEYLYWKKPLTRKYARVS